MPAEVLAAHAFLLTQTTETTKGQDDKDVTTFTEPGLLKFVFWALLVAAAFLYFLKKRKTFHGWDVARMLIPAGGFFLWAMLTPSSAFDAQFDWTGTVRIVIAVIGAVFLGAIAKQLGVKADEES